VPEVNDGKITAYKVDIVFLIDEVDDHSRDGEEDLLVGLIKYGGGTRSKGNLEEKVLNEIVVIQRMWFAKRTLQQLLV